jgi:hypothetical protein
VFGGLPGGSGGRGQVASWFYVAFVAICAILVVGGLVKALFYIVDVIDATRPK